MKSQPEIFRERTKRFALGVLTLWRSLPRSEEARILGKQLLRSATSVAANYRAVCRARSKAEFVAKIGVVVEEADECVFWLELLRDGRVVPPEQLAPLVREAEELVAVFAASQRTARSNSMAQ